MASPIPPQPGVKSVSVNQKAPGKKKHLEAPPAPNPPPPSHSSGQAPTSKKNDEAQVTKSELIDAPVAAELDAKPKDRSTRRHKRKRRSVPNTTSDDADDDAPEDAPPTQAQDPTPESAEQRAVADPVWPLSPVVNSSDSDDLHFGRLLEEALLSGNPVGYGTNFIGGFPLSGVFDEEHRANITGTSFAPQQLQEPMLDGGNDFDEESQWGSDSDEDESALIGDLGLELLAHRAMIGFHGEDTSDSEEQERPKKRAKKYCDTCLMKKKVTRFSMDDDELDRMETCTKCHEDIQEDETWGLMWPTNEASKWSTDEQMRAQMLVFGNIGMH